MSRSKRKTNKMGVCAVSEKQDKKRWHRNARRKITKFLKNLDALTEQVLFSKDDKRLHSNPWNMSKDGKIFFNDPKYLRK